jgi:DNA-binding response OmpR family regulator
MPPTILAQREIVGAGKPYYQNRMLLKDQTGKLLLVESDDALRATLIDVLRNAGYDISTDYRGGMKAVLAFEPDLIILGADPPQLDCCDLLSEIKASRRTHNMRVVMLVHGSEAERTGGLDLGADDALSLPLDPAELLARIRSQLRNKQIADERTASRVLDWRANRHFIS